MLKNLRLRMKIGIGFSLVLILTIAVGIIGYHGLQQVLNSSNELQTANEMVFEIQSARQSELSYALNKDPLTAGEVRTTVKKLIEKTELNAVNAGPVQESGNKTEAVKLGKKYLELFNRLVELDRMKKESADIMTETAEKAAAIIDELKVEQSRELDNKRDNIRQTRSDCKWKASAADKLIKLVTGAENYGLTYFINNEKDFMAKMEKNLEEAKAFCGELFDRAGDADEMELAGRSREAINAFSDALFNYDNYRKNKQFLGMAVSWKKLTESSETIKDILGDLKERAVNKSETAETALLKIEVDRAKKIADANELLNKINEANARSIVFQITGDELVFAELGDLLSSIQSSTMDLREELGSAAAYGKADEVIAGIQDYLDQTIQYKTFFDEQKSISLETARNSIQGQKEFAVIKQNQSDLMAQIQNYSKYSIMLGTGLAVLLGLAVSFFISKGLTGPIKRAVKLAGSIRGGDLSQRIEINSRDEIGELAEALNSMADTLEKKAVLATSIAGGDLTASVDLASDADVLGAALHQMVGSLNEVLRQVDSAVSQAATGSAQVADSSQALSQGASEQASSLEEITSALNEIGAQTNDNARMAAKANETALGSRKKMEEGVKIMSHMIEAMDEINKSSHQISKIIKTIDDIAFQTNLLALNAAVEAARAGIHGKGFAVVAEEVRNLAGRSAAAAQETEVLIEDSVKKAENGMELVQQTSTALNQIKEANIGVVDLINKIAEASNEQATGLSQINAGLEQVEKVTQSNTANAEETASASEELSGQAAALKKLLTKFKLNELTMDETRELPSPEFNGGEMNDRPRLPAEDAGSMEKRRVKPNEIIALDDDDFGKY